MGWQDRDYNRGYRGGGGGLAWLLYGSVPLFRAFRIDVRAHVSLLIYLFFGLLGGFSANAGWTIQNKLIGAGALFTIVLLHEFGHCFACRYVRGSADEIIMHPLGGLALCAPPHTPWATFVTVAGGPAVNVVICLVAGAILLATTGWLPGNPFDLRPPRFTADQSYVELSVYAFWVYQMSWTLLVFNLLPIFPLDGGQMLHTALWPRVGFFRSMKFSTEVGLFAAVGGGAFALANGYVSLAVLAAFGFYTCYVMRQQLLANGPAEFDAVSYAVGPEPRARVKKKSWFAARRERAEKRALETEAADVDRILEKVARTGMNSLSGRERKTLQKASENQRKRDAKRGGVF